MPWYPAARRVPLPWFGYPAGERGGNDPRAVVHHIASGWWATLTDVGFWATRNGGSGGSVHFAVSQAGEVVQFVDTDDAAYGNGIVLNPSWEPVSLGNPNERTISIEHEGLTGVPWPEPMYGASLALTRWILETHGLAAGPETVIGHYRIDSVNRSQCPGLAWPIGRYLTDLEDELMGFTPEQFARLQRIADHRTGGDVAFADALASLVYLGQPGKDALVAFLADGTLPAPHEHPVPPQLVLIAERILALEGSTDLWRAVVGEIRTLSDPAVRWRCIAFLARLLRDNAVAAGNAGADGVAWKPRQLWIDGKAPPAALAGVLREPQDERSGGDVRDWDTRNV